ncbi:MAG: LUD domain-containing protein [Desulfatirhabdiaceae bacterium]
MGCPKIGYPLVPSIHVAVIRLEQLLADLKELYALLRWDAGQQAEGLTHHMVMISGPSKTADIELVMVHGAHGPREVHLVVITGG